MLKWLGKWLVNANAWGCSTLPRKRLLLHNSDLVSREETSYGAFILVVRSPSTFSASGHFYIPKRNLSRKVCFILHGWSSTEAINHFEFDHLISITLSSPPHHLEATDHGHLWPGSHGLRQHGSLSVLQKTPINSSNSRSHQPPDYHHHKIVSGRIKNDLQGRRRCSGSHCVSWCIRRWKTSDWAADFSVFLKFFDFLRGFWVFIFEKTVFSVLKINRFFKMIFQSIKINKTRLIERSFY